MVSRSIMAVPALGYKCRQADRIDCLTRSGRSRSLRIQECWAHCTGRRASPGTLVTGLASRSQYVWVGGGYTRFAEASHDRRPTLSSWSAVYGYRPSRLRRGYDQWDYRGFAELTGEHTGAVRTDGLILPNSSSTTVWLGPSVLAIFKNIAIEGGVQGPLFRDVSESVYGRERLRFAINLSYLKYSSHTSSH